MTTDKELAAARRVLAEWCDEHDMPGAAATHRAIADEHDPKKPEYPDGLYEFTTDALWNNGNSTIYMRRKNGEWINPGGDATQPPRSSLWTPRRLRVLADDEIALPRGIFAGYRSSALRDMSHWQGRSVVVGELLRFVADALDAEAGDAK